MSWRHPGRWVNARRAIIDTLNAWSSLPDTSSTIALPVLTVYDDGSTDTPGERRSTVRVVAWARDIEAAEDARDTAQKNLLEASVAGINSIVPGVTLAPAWDDRTELWMAGFTVIAIATST